MDLTRIFEKKNRIKWNLSRYMGRSKSSAEKENYSTKNASLSKEESWVNNEVSNSRS